MEVKVPSQRLYDQLYAALRLRRGACSATATARSRPTCSSTPRSARLLRAQRRPVRQDARDRRPRPTGAWPSATRPSRARRARRTSPSAARRPPKGAKNAIPLPGEVTIHARVHVHELRGPLPLRRGAHEGRDAGHAERRRGQPDDGAQLRRRRRRVRRRVEHADQPRHADRHQQQQRLHVPPPPGAGDDRRAQAGARGLERRRRRRGAGDRVGRHDAAAARRGLPARVLHALHGPDRDHRPVRLAGGRVLEPGRDRQPAEPHARLPPQGADRHGRQPRRARTPARSATSTPPRRSRP